MLLDDLQSATRGLEHLAARLESWPGVVARNSQRVAHVEAICDATTVCHAL